MPSRLSNFTPFAALSRPLFTASMSSDPIKRDLALWRRFPAAMQLICTQSEVFLSHEKDDNDGTFVWPILEPFVSRGNAEDGSGAARSPRGGDGSNEDVEEAMSLLEHLAALSKDPEPTKDAIYRIGEAPLFPSLATFPPFDDGGGSYFDRLIEISDYFGLKKSLTARLKLVKAAERVKATSRADLVARVLADPLLLPLLRGVAEQLTEEASKLGISSVEASVSSLVADEFFLQGALGVPSKEVKGALGLSIGDAIKANMHYQTGRAVAGRPLIPSELRVLNDQTGDQRARGRSGDINTTCSKCMEAIAMSGNMAACWTLSSRGFTSPPSFAQIAASKGCCLPGHC